MKLSFLANIGLFSLAAGIALPNPAPKGHEYHPPGLFDSRSPCPGLNAMANHGYLPHSGKNIDIEAVRSGVAAAYNYESHVFDPAFEAAVNFKLTTTGNASTFNLADLAKHDTIEFDGSLSRNDFFFGDDNHFNPLIWWTTAERLGLHKPVLTEQDKYVTVETAAEARAARVKDAKLVNPTFNASAGQIGGSPATTALYLTTLWDDKAGAARKSWIRSFFEEERIPYLEGYSAATQSQKTSDFVFGLIGRINSVPV
ncbi:Chloroperoxidase [Podospora didyma]|uniref:Chloroperoxidase n=1 Tax=Podospora didyma TaxID=330526 RepID=A0AAE0NXJ9_9PEZI|nr:Chloroperoxidase [Podospora didyma]